MADLADGPDTRRRTPISSEHVVLGAVQLLLAAYCVCAAVVMPTVGSRWDGVGGAVVLVLLAATTLAARPEAGSILQNVVVAGTSALIAALTAIRTTGQGQLVMGLFLLMLAMWCAGYLPRRAAAAHIGFAMSAYVVVLVLRPHTGSAVYVAALLVGTVFASAMVLQGRQARSRYTNLLGGSVDVMLQTANGRMTWVSPTVADVLGWSPTEFLALPDPTWHPDDDAIVQRLRQRLHAGKPAAATYRLRHRDGTYRWIEARLSPLSDAGAAAGSVGVLRDVTERVTAEAAVAQSLSRHRHGLRRLRRADAARTRRFHEISHELRTPLTVIRGPLERHLRRDPDLSEDLRADLEAAVRASRRLEALVNGILDVERADAVRPAARVPADVAALTAEVVDVLQPSADAAGLLMSVEVDHPFPPELACDTEAWARIVLNLVSNAIKYTASGSVQVHLRFVDGWIELRVADTGRGIAEDDLTRVFDRFYTAGSAPYRDSARTGLGLALVADAVTEAGGHVDVSSQAGLGTVFVVAMPMSGPDAPAEAPTDRPTTSAADRRPVTDADPIGDALGLLMDRDGLSADQALTELRGRSRGRPLGVAAAEILAEDDDSPPPGHDGL